jgi:hypothetical protein
VYECCCRMDLVMTLVVINFGPCVEYQVVWNVVEIKVCHVCIYVPRVMTIFVHLGLL